MAVSVLFLQVRAALFSPFRKGIFPELRPVSSLPGGGSGFSDSEIDLEMEQDLDVDPESLELSVLKRQKKAIWYQRLKKEMEPPGPPERRLTWAAMEQIRHLKQEFPEEWTVHRLAEGFNVTPDVIKRVLKSKFSAPPARRMKQNAKAAANLKWRQLPQYKDQDPVQPKIQAGYQTQQLKQICDGHRRTQGSTLPATLQVQPSCLPMAMAEKNYTLKKWKQESQLQIDKQSKPDLECAAPLTLTNRNLNTGDESFASQEQVQLMKEEWNGELLPEEELERLEEMGQENRMKVVQKGREFFDSDGNFLYRI